MEERVMIVGTCTGGAEGLLRQAADIARISTRKKTEKAKPRGYHDHTKATLAGSKYGPREANYRNCGMLNCNVLKYGICLGNALGATYESMYDFA